MVRKACLMVCRFTLTVTCAKTEVDRKATIHIAPIFFIIFPFFRKEKIISDFLFILLCSIKWLITRE